MTTIDPDVRHRLEEKRARAWCWSEVILYTNEGARQLEGEEFRTTLEALKLRGYRNIDRALNAKPNGKA
jgi:hypothetical protein